MNKSIYIIRHGQTDYNRLRIVQGSGVDSDLNDWGRGQGRQFFEAYQTTDFDIVLTSKLKRTQQTVQHFLDKGLPHEAFTELNEISWGIHEGKTGDIALRDEYLKINHEWNNGNYDARIGGGESAAELANRLRIFIEHLKQRTEQKILVCSHGRAMRCLISLMKGLPISAMEQFEHHNTGLYLAQQVGDTFHFIKENNIDHLDTEKLKTGW